MSPQGRFCLSTGTGWVKTSCCWVKTPRATGVLGLKHHDQEVLLGQNTTATGVLGLKHHNQEVLLGQNTTSDRCWRIVVLGQHWWGLSTGVVGKNTTTTPILSAGVVWSKRHSNANTINRCCWLKTPTGVGGWSFGTTLCVVYRQVLLRRNSATDRCCCQITSQQRWSSHRLVLWSLNITTVPNSFIDSRRKVKAPRLLWFPLSTGSSRNAWHTEITKSHRIKMRQSICRLASEF